jgi:hypothetical protein
VHHIRFFPVGDEVALCVFGQAGLYLGKDLRVLAISVVLLAGLGGRARARSGAEGSLSDIYLERRIFGSLHQAVLPC